MWFLIKAAMAFVLLVMLMSVFDGGSKGPSTSNRKPVAQTTSPTPPVEVPSAKSDAADAISTAIAAIKDVQRLCKTDPDICRAGANAVKSLDLSPEKAARLARYLAGQPVVGKPSMPTIDTQKTGAIAPAPPLPVPHRVPVPTFIR